MPAANAAKVHPEPFFSPAETTIMARISSMILRLLHKRETLCCPLSLPLCFSQA
jgi:hypothetical protein